MRAWSRHPRRSVYHHAAAAFATAAVMLALPAPAKAQYGDYPPAMGAPAAPAETSYSQHGIPAEATAENAVVARERALAAGRRAAWERLASELGIRAGNLSDSQIESMVSSIIIEEERTTPTRYSGRITVNFNPRRVRPYGGASTAEGAATPEEMGVAGPRPSGPAVATVEAVAQYGSLSEWQELRRRLNASPGVARLDVVAISTDRARVRLGLRAAPTVAAEQLAQAGVALSPQPTATGEGWRVGLAGRF